MTCWKRVGICEFLCTDATRQCSSGCTRNGCQLSAERPERGTSIARTSDSSFNLSDIGTYFIEFFVSVDEAGQLILTLNGADLEYTVAGRATGASQIVGTAIVTTNVTNSILTVQNPAGNVAALTITPLAGGTRPVSAHLVIMQID